MILTGLSFNAQERVVRDINIMAAYYYIKLFYFCAQQFRVLNLLMETR